MDRKPKNRDRERRHGTQRKYNLDREEEQRESKQQERGYTH